MYEKRYSDMADAERVKLESDVEDSYDIYPHPTVRVVRPHNRGIGTSWKEALTELTQRKAFLGGLAVLVFIVLLSIVIILMVQNHHEEAAKQQVSRRNSYGLFSYPYTESGDVIKFKPDDYLTYRDLMGQLEDALAPYSPQLLTSPKYTHCDLRDRVKGEQCMFHIYDLGLRCSHGQDFGYSKSQPCVLLQLKLPFHPGKVANNSGTWKRLYNEMGDRWHPSFVGIKCEGSTELDNKYLNGSGKSLSYTPSTGFLARFFPSDLNDELYLPPLVMVQIPILPPHQPVTVRCTAWAQFENGTLPQVHPSYTTEFKIQLD